MGHIHKWWWTINHHSSPCCYSRVSQVCQRSLLLQHFVPLIHKTQPPPPRFPLTADECTSGICSSAHECVAVTISWIKEAKLFKKRHHSPSHGAHMYCMCVSVRKRESSGGGGKGRGVDGHGAQVIYPTAAFRCFWPVWNRWQLWWTSHISHFWTSFYTTCTNACSTQTHPATMHILHFLFHHEHPG